MPSETDIVNRSLRLIKAQRITSLTDGQTNSNIANDVYVQVRDELLRGHSWNFAMLRAKLARSNTTPAFEFDHGYVLPSDWGRTVSVHDNDAGAGTIRFKEEQLADQNVLMASVEDCYLRYVGKLTDPNLMPEDFHAAQAYALAVAMPGISNISVARWEFLEKQATRRLSRAKSSDAMGSSPERRPRGSWANSRGGWRSRWPATG